MDKTREQILKITGERIRRAVAVILRTPQKSGTFLPPRGVFQAPLIVFATLSSAW